MQSKHVEYLPGNHVHRVHGTWDVCNEAIDADIVVFVYPRTGRLVQQHLERCALRTRAIIWLGPEADWVEQEAMLNNVASFEQSIFRENSGIAPYERYIVFYNRRFRLESQEATTDMIVDQ